MNADLCLLAKLHEYQFNFSESLKISQLLTKRKTF